MGARSFEDAVVIAEVIIRIALTAESDGLGILGENAYFFKGGEAPVTGDVDGFLNGCHGTYEGGTPC